MYYDTRARLSKKPGLAISGSLTIAMPIILGVMNVPLLCAQNQPGVPKFEVASIRRHTSQEPIPVLAFVRRETW